MTPPEKFVASELRIREIVATHVLTLLVPYRMMRGVKLHAALQMFVNESSSCRTPISRASAQRRLGLLGRMFPGLELHQFGTAELTAYCLAGGTAPNTVRAKKALARSFFEWCTYMKLLDRNPATDLKFTVKPGSQPVRVNHWLSEEEVGGVLRRIDTTELADHRTKIVLMIGFMMGLRIFEIAGLRWDNFTHDLSRVTFVGKGNKLATLGVPPQVRDELRLYHARFPKDCKTLLPAFTINRFNDPQPRWDVPLGSSRLSQVVMEASRAVGIPFAPHDMRRSFAGILEAKGVELRQISQLLRHSNVAITETYLEKNPHKVAAMADTFTIAL